MQPAEAVTERGRTGRETAGPETARPDAARPHAARPDAAQPYSARSYTTRSYTTGSTTARSNTSRSSTARPYTAGAASTVRSPGSARARGRAERRPASFRSHVTTRGAVVGMLLLSLVACLLAAWLSAGELAGIGFCAGCVLAPLYARRDAQLQIVASAPVIFLAAVVVTQVVTAQGSSNHGRLESVLEGTLLTLASAAPWLFAGTAACIGLAWRMGLPDCVRELRSGLREARSSAASRSAVRPARQPPFAARGAARKPFARALPRLPRR